MAQTAALLKAQADADAAAGGYTSLHTANPGLTGASEVVATGSAVYARQQTSYAVADTSTAGVALRVGTAGGAHAVPAGTTITHWGRWSAVSGGTFMEGGALPASEQYTGDGSYTFNHTVRVTG